VLHYEAPFGVGYLVAQITNAKQSPNELNESESHAVADEDKSEPPALAGGPLLKDGHLKHDAQDLDRAQLPALARNAVETFVLTGSQIEPASNAAGILGARAACFVSIKTASGDLRGCIGTIDPTRDTLAEELIVNAMHAASRDPRFPPVSAGELPDLRYSVDVLSAPEPATFEQLDAKIYGVIVEDEGGNHRGLLLPDLQGVDTASKQVEIATRKAGIKPGSPLKLFRFRVARFRENGERD
jgi:AmmeMemoRadiSam system protein A